MCRYKRCGYEFMKRERERTQDASNRESDRRGAAGLFLGLMDGWSDKRPCDVSIIIVANRPQLFRIISII